VVTRRSTRQFDGLNQQDHRGGAIHVVIAIDQNVRGREWRAPAGLWPRHIAHGERIVEVVREGFRKSARGIGVIESTVQQDLMAGAVKLERGGEGQTSCGRSVGRAAVSLTG